MNNVKHAHLHWSNPTWNDHKPRVLPSLPYPNPNPHPSAPPSPAPCPLTLIPTSLPHPHSAHGLPLFLAPASPNLYAWIHVFHTPSLYRRWRPGWEEEAGGWDGGRGRWGSCWFRFWSPLIKNTMSSSEYRVRTWDRGVLLCVEVEGCEPVCVCVSVFTVALGESYYVLV